MWTPCPFLDGQRACWGTWWPMCWVGIRLLLCQAPEGGKERYNHHWVGVMELICYVNWMACERTWRRFHVSHSPYRVC